MKRSGWGNVTDDARNCSSGLKRRNVEFGPVVPCFGAEFGNLGCESTFAVSVNHFKLCPENVGDRHTHG